MSPPLSISTAAGFFLPLAHQGGWDEILLVAAPLAIVGLLLYVANRRVNAQLAQAGDPADLESEAVQDTALQSEAAQDTALQSEAAQDTALQSEAVQDTALRSEAVRDTADSTSDPDPTTAVGSETVTEGVETAESEDSSA